MSWRAGKAEPHGTRVMTDTGGSVAWVPTVSSSEKSHCVTPEEAHRRAVLMAAAPDLFEALQKIATIENKMYGPDWEEIEEARQIARSAIAKATGEQK